MDWGQNWHTGGFQDAVCVVADGIDDNITGSYFQEQRMEDTGVLENSLSDATCRDNSFQVYVKFSSFSFQSFVETVATTQPRVSVWAVSF